MKTSHAKPGEIERKWHVVDARDIPVGRLASRVAMILRGKNKPQFTPQTDTGDFVVVINAAQIKLTGGKLQGKNYYRHTDYPGGLRATTAQSMLDKHPERVLEIAVKGMLPRTPLGRKVLRKLKVYSGSEHPHAAQQPTPLVVTKDQK